MPCPLLATLLGLLPGQCRGNARERHQGRQGAIVAVSYRDQDGQEHEERADQQRVTHVPGYHLDIHHKLFIRPEVINPLTELLVLPHKLSDAIIQFRELVIAFE